MKKIVIPNIKKLGFKIFTFYILKFSPRKRPTEQDFNFLNSSSTMFFANRRFEAVIISVYRDYNAYKEDRMQKYRYLQKNEIKIFNPIVKRFEYDRVMVIKDITFAPLTEKILQHDDAS